MVARHSGPTGDGCVVPNALLQACGWPISIHELQNTEHPKLHICTLVRARLTEVLASHVLIDHSVMSFEFDDESMCTKPDVNVGAAGRDAFDLRSHIPAPKISGQPLPKIGLELKFRSAWIAQVRAARPQLLETRVLAILAEKDNLKHELIEIVPDYAVVVRALGKGDANIRKNTLHDGMNDVCASSSPIVEQAFQTFGEVGRHFPHSLIILEDAPELGVRGALLWFSRLCGAFHEFVDTRAKRSRNLSMRFQPPRFAQEIVKVAKEPAFTSKRRFDARSEQCIKT